MAEISNCGCEDCIWNNYGECEADDVEIDYESTGSGFVPSCQTFKEKEE